ncbi:MAG: cellulase family glycosylhydrolase, partial [Chloroflexota bacterium]
MVLSTRLRVVLTAALLILLMFLAAAFHSAAAAPLEGPSAASIQGGKLALPGKGPSFLLAVNYEGPADRAWQMWEDGQFDAGLIEADLRRARAAGFSTVRVFVQPPLVKEIQANRWDKLDSFLTMAQRQGLSVILALYDYGERDLAKVADVDGRIAARYAKNPTILAYDLKNEPHFSDLSSALYPGGARSPIQTAGADETLKSYQEFVAAAGAWVTERNYLVSTLDYIDSPEGRRWDGLLGTVNASLSMWLQPQIDAIRKADNQRPITVAYSDLILAKLPANGTLDYVTIHRYPNASGKAVEGVARVLNNLRAAFREKPVLLGEFGFSNSGMSPEESANYETAVYVLLLSEGLSGGAKWMLNDFPRGTNPRQNAFGAFLADGAGKPVVPAVRGLADYVNRGGMGGGHLYLPDKRSPGYRWAYETGDALVVSADSYEGARLSFDAQRLSQLFLTWTDPKVMRIYSTSATELELDAAALVNDPGMGTGYALARVEGGSKAPTPFSRNGSRLKMSLEGERWYELSLPRSQEGPNAARPQDYDIP